MKTAMPVCPQCSKELSGNPSVCEFCRFPIGARDPYDIVAEELQRKSIIPGLWTHVYSEAGGDESRARALYIQYRVTQLAPTSPQSSATTAHVQPAEPFIARDFGTAWIWAWVVACAMLTVSGVGGSVYLLFTSRFGPLALYIPLAAFFWWATGTLFSNGIARLQARATTGTYFFVEIAMMTVLAVFFLRVSASDIGDMVSVKVLGIAYVFIIYGIMHIFRSKRLKQATRNA